MSERTKDIFAISIKKKNAKLENIKRCDKITSFVTDIQCTNFPINNNNVGRRPFSAIDTHFSRKTVTVTRKKVIDDCNLNTKRASQLLYAKDSWIIRSSNIISFFKKLRERIINNEKNVKKLKYGKAFIQYSNED